MVERDQDEDIAVTFDDFGWRELCAEATASRCSEAELIGLAISDYLGSLRDSGTSAYRAPGFLRDRTASRPRHVDVELSHEQLWMLEVEAARQQISVSQLVIHAVMIRLGRS